MRKQKSAALVCPLELFVKPYLILNILNTYLITPEAQPVVIFSDLKWNTTLVRVDEGQG